MVVFEGTADAGAGPASVAVAAARGGLESAERIEARQQRVRAPPLPPVALDLLHDACDADALARSLIRIANGHRSVRKLWKH